MFGDLFAPSLTRTALSPAIARSTVQTQNAPYEALLSRRWWSLWKHYICAYFVPNSPENPTQKQQKTHAGR